MPDDLLSRRAVVVCSVEEWLSVLSALEVLAQVTTHNYLGWPARREAAERILEALSLVDAERSAQTRIDLSTLMAVPRA